MHTHDLSRWTPSHQFDQGNTVAERRTRLVMWITAITMLVEIAAGWWFNSMALLADGWHMSSHALALGLTAFAYGAARRYAEDHRFAFGTWKIEVLAAFISALMLLAVAALMVYSSLERMLAPQPIHYVEAIVIAVLGLFINIWCAFILGGHHDHDHGHDHGHEHAHDAAHKHAHAGDSHDGAGHDLNLKSAYVHVITDAATSVLAIAALVGGLFYGWAWLDPAMGIVGALLVGIWAKGLLAETVKILLDREMDHAVVDEIRGVVETQLAEGDTKLADIHVWRVGKKSFACIISVVTHNLQLTPEVVKQALAQHEELVHCTVEINHCLAHHD